MHRPADAPAPSDHIHALPRRLVVDVDVEGALVRLRDRVLDLSEVEAQDVVEPGVDGEDPGEVVVEVDLRARAHGPHRRVHALRRGVR